MEDEQRLLSIENGELENGHHSNPEQESLQEKKNKILIRGIEVGDVQNVRKIVKKGADVNHVIKGTNKTPLSLIMRPYTAPPENYRRIIMILLKARANANTRNEHGMTILHMAAKWKDLSLAKLAVHCGGTVDILSNSGRTPLGMAIQRSPNAPSISSVKFLLDLGANVNLRNGDGDTVLHRIYEAPRSETEQILDTLIHRGIDVNCQNYAGNTPLHVAVFENEFQAAQILLNCTACDLTLKSYAGETALHLAVRKNNIQCARILLNAGCNIDDKISSLEKLSSLHVAATRGHVHMFELLMSFNPDLSSLTHRQHTILHSAVVGGSAKIVETLLRPNIDVNAQANDGNTPIHFAVQMNNINIIKLLLNNKVDLNIKNKHGQTPLHMSSHVATAAISKLLIDNGADVTTRCNNNRSILQSAFCSGNKEVFKFLLSPLCQPKFEECIVLLESVVDRQWLRIMNVLISDYFNSVDKNCEVKLRLSAALIQRRCPELIYSAAEDGLVNIINLTTDDGYDVNQLVGGRSFLDAAVKAQSTDIAHLLLNRGCLPNISDSKCFNCLHRAVWNKNQAMTELLLEYGANVNVLSVDHKNTTLHYAVEKHCHDKILIAILAYGADLHAINDKNYTPLISSLMYSQWLTIHLVKFEVIANERGQILPMHQHIFKDGEYLHSLYVECLGEIEIAKTYFIHSRLSVWDLLWKPFPSLIPFLNFSAVTDFMRRKEFCAIFKHYTPIIDFKLMRAMEKKVIHNEIHHHLMDIIGLPALILDNILSYLTDGEKKLMHYRFVHQ